MDAKEKFKVSFQIKKSKIKIKILLKIVFAKKKNVFGMKEDHKHQITCALEDLRLRFCWQN